MRYDLFFLVIFLYGLLTILNAYAFKILEKHGKKYWEHEGVPFQRFLLKKLGIIPSAIVSFIIFCSIFLSVSLSSSIPDFIAGFTGGALSFNIIADFWTFTHIMKQIEGENENGK